jgi:hypothetical protein
MSVSQKVWPSYQPGQPCRDRSRSQRVPRRTGEEGEADRRLELRVVADHGSYWHAEVIEVLALTRDQALPALVTGLRERSLDLVAHRRKGAPARPAVGQGLDHPEPLAGLEVRRDRDPAEILAAQDVCRRLGWRIDQVVHRRRHEQVARRRPVRQRHPQLVV